jgi:hypothetical protein
MMKHTKLITVLLFAVMIIVLAYLVMSVTSCSPTLTMTRPTPTVQPTPTVPTIIENGTIHHPYHVDYCPCGVPFDLWNVTLISGSSSQPWSIKGREKWQLNWLYGPHGLSEYTLRFGDYISYQDKEYQLTAITRRALTMTVIILSKGGI